MYINLINDTLFCILYIFVQNELQQLREMGITDESVARRALEASGGDVQGALEIIFGNGL